MTIIVIWPGIRIHDNQPTNLHNNIFVFIKCLYKCEWCGWFFLRSFFVGILFVCTFLWRDKASLGDWIYILMDIWQINCEIHSFLALHQQIVRWISNLGVFVSGFFSVPKKCALPCWVGLILDGNTDNNWLRSKTIKCNRITQSVYKDEMYDCITMHGRSWQNGRICIYKYHAIAQSKNVCIMWKCPS